MMHFRGSAVNFFFLTEPTQMHSHFHSRQHGMQSVILEAGIIAGIVVAATRWFRHRVCHLSASCRKLSLICCWYWRWCTACDSSSGNLAATEQVRAVRRRAWPVWCWRIFQWMKTTASRLTSPRIGFRRFQRDLYHHCNITIVQIDSSFPLSNSRYENQYIISRDWLYHSSSQRTFSCVILNRITLW